MTSIRSKWQSIVAGLFTFNDPSSLGITRFIFGYLMMVDTVEERGMSYIDDKWADSTACYFPLFNFMKPLQLSYMYLVYIIMLTGACGIMLGFFFQLSCLLYVVPYYYIFLLEKNTWNNHSYLFGLFAILLACTKANHYWSVDGVLWPKLRNCHVPRWNYEICRIQLFIVYFIAGIKKLDWDWINGQTLHLSSHWIFLPFTYVMSWETIDRWIVHRGGLVIDLFIGFLLYCAKTRPIAFVFGASFHFMNSQIFPIGMFPYVMLVTMPIFSAPDWPKRVMSRLPVCLWSLLPSLAEAQPSSDCFYPPQPSSSAKKTSTRSDVSKTAKPCTSDWQPKLSHHFIVMLLGAYVALQGFLPFSHFITKGYNNWTNGLYGYSWDMMVHVWNTQKAVITYVDADTGEMGYLNPESYLRGGRSDWTDHADMAKQYAVCLRDRLRTEHGIYVSAIYFDVWKSLNGRFHQRIFNPTENILTADNWHPLRRTAWLMPLLVDLSDWRPRLKQTINELVANDDHASDVAFFADFPGFSMENYVQEDFGNTSLRVLQGSVRVEMEGNTRPVTVSEGATIQIPAGQFHTVHTVSDTPSCYMYIYVNTTQRDLHKRLVDYEQHKTAPSYQKQARVEMYEELLLERERSEARRNMSFIDRLALSLADKYDGYTHAFQMAGLAVESILTGVPMEQMMPQKKEAEFHSEL